MAKVKGMKGETVAKRTSIGNSSNSRPKNKNTRQQRKSYRGQGR